MKTFTPQSILTAIIITLFSISMFANGLEFRVKIFEPSSSIDSLKLCKYKPLYVQKQFTEVGSFEDYLFAMKEQYNLEDLGYPSTEIVAYFNFQPVSIEDAFTILDDRNQQDQKNQGPMMTETQMDFALKQVQNENFYYTVKIEIDDDEAVNQFFDFPQKIDETVTPKGFYQYTYGRFYTVQDAKDALLMLKEYNLLNAEVIAFDNTERIPLTIAAEKEKRLLEQTIAQLSD